MTNDGARQAPLGRVAPEEFADAVVFGERARQIHRRVALAVDGGIVRGLYELASVITHFVVGAALALPAMEVAPLRGVIARWALPVTAGLFAVTPDLDTYAMIAFGIPRGSFFSHRGFFHSPFFLMLLAFAAAALVTRLTGGRAFLWLVVVWAGAAITHPVLDMLTDAGSGVMLLIPFSSERFLFPWRPIHIPPGIAGFFDRQGQILPSELPFRVAAVALGLTARQMVAASSWRVQPERKAVGATSIPGEVR